jgi:predicted RNA-binding Zn ribbon-like protein
VPPTAPGSLELVRAFASTHAYRGHEDELPVRAVGLRTLRRRLRELIGDGGDVEWFNERVRRCGVIPEIHDGRVRHRPGSRAGLEGQLLAAVVDAIADGSWGRLRICANDAECGVVFYDRSPNRSARWCDPSVCGNRCNVRAHRERAKR